MSERLLEDETVVGDLDGLDRYRGGLGVQLGAGELRRPASGERPDPYRSQDTVDGAHQHDGPVPGGDAARDVELVEPVPELLQQSRALVEHQVRERGAGRESVRVAVLAALLILLDAHLSRQA